MLNRSNVCVCVRERMCVRVCVPVRPLITSVVKQMQM